MRTRHSVLRRIVKSGVFWRLPGLWRLLSQRSYQVLELALGKPISRSCVGGPACSLRSKRRLGVTIPSSAVILILMIGVLTSAIGYRFYNEPRLAIETRAPQTIKAPANAAVVNEKATDAARKKAREQSPPVLALNQRVNQQSARSLQEFIRQGNELRQILDGFPFVKTSILSTATQLYLRQIPEEEWQTIQFLAENSSDSDTSLSRVLSPELRQLLKAEQAPNVANQQAIRELQTYQQAVSSEAFSTLLKTIAKARLNYSKTIAALANPSFSEVTLFQEGRLLDLADADWKSTVQGLELVMNRMLSQGIALGLPAEVLQNAIALQVKDAIPVSARSLVSQFLLKTLQPNLMQDIERTRLLRDRAAQEVKPVLIQVQQGDVIVQQGTRINEQQFLLLDYFDLSRREVNWRSLLRIALGVTIGIGIFWLVERRFQPRLRWRDHLLVLLLVLSTPLVVALGVTSTSLPAIGLLIGSFYGSSLAVTVVGVLAILLPFGLKVSLSVILASALGGILGGWVSGRLRSREELALLGGMVALVQSAAYFLVNFAQGQAWSSLLGKTALQGGVGLICSIIALGLMPYLEHLFDLVTPIRLAELANPNRPLLKRLAAEAPGTFQHTLFVATLAEAAAQALGCNVELVRTGTLYHDIGKMHDPLGFIENQMGGPNKHDLIDDPWESANIIKKHVTEGLVMARKFRLPKAIQAFIPEHQGTMSIAYFYHQAQQLAEQDSSLVVREADFRYEGPIPQSRETGIVMLADSCEAALRSLKETSTETALTMVNKILRARWQDQQLIDSGLTREDLGRIATIFVQVWQQFHHQRIAYPKLVALSSPSSSS